MSSEILWFEIGVGICKFDNEVFEEFKNYQLGQLYFEDGSWDQVPRELAKVWCRRVMAVYMYIWALGQLDGEIEHGNDHCPKGEFCQQ